MCILIYIHCTCIFIFKIANEVQEAFEVFYVYVTGLLECNVCFKGYFIALTMKKSIHGSMNVCVCGPCKQYHQLQSYNICSYEQFHYFIQMSNMASFRRIDTAFSLFAQAFMFPPFFLCCKHNFVKSFTFLIYWEE